MSQEQERFKVIDIMNSTFTPKAKQAYWNSEVYAYVSRRLKGGKGEGQTHQVFSTAKEAVDYMDEVGVDKVFITALEMYSHREKKSIRDETIDDVYALTKQYPKRLIGSASYNPWRIEESLKTIEKAVKEYNFKFVYFHSLSFNCPLNDKKLYPCYAKCNELGVPVGMQVGHSAENLPSEPGRPIYLDEVALDFPNLTIVASHTGWPWVEELVAMSMKHENIYVDTAAWFPRMWHDFQPSFLRFITSRVGQEKAIYGTNGRSWKQYKEEFMQLPMRDETRRKILYENAMRVFKLEE